MTGLDLVKEIFDRELLDQEFKVNVTGDVEEASNVTAIYFDEAEDCALIDIEL